MIRTGIIGTGSMAAFHARKFAAIPDCELAFACDVDEARVRNFSAEHGIGHWFADAEEMLGRSDLDAVSIVAPDRFHHPLALAALAAGKHVLCEKPLGLDHAQTEEMRDAARAAGLVNMVHFTYRNSPAIQKAVEWVDAGELGGIRHVYAHYNQSWLVHDYWGDWRGNPGLLWRLSKAHGSGGALGDIGIHILDFASMPLGTLAAVHCRLGCFAKPDAPEGGGYSFDANDTALITAEFTNGALGTIQATRWAYPHKNSLRLILYGDRATLEIDLDQSEDTFRINRVSDRRETGWQTVECGQVPNIHERFIRAIRTGEPEQPDFARGAEIQAVIDACHRSALEDRTIRLP